ncbi:MAG TPA: hypothetical protein VF748_07510 [Candidatus Acidoferrum sp.]
MSNVFLAHCEWPDALQRKARAALRRYLKQCPKFATNNLDADVVIEQVWNAIVGLDRVRSKR